MVFLSLFRVLGFALIRLFGLGVLWGWISACFSVVSVDLMSRCGGDLCGGSWCLVVLGFVAPLRASSWLCSASGVGFQLSCLFQVKLWFGELGSVTSLAPDLRSRTCWRCGVAAGSSAGAFADVVFGFSSTLALLLLIVSARSLILGESLCRLDVSMCAWRCLYPEFGILSPVLVLQLVLSCLWLCLIGSGWWGVVCFFGLFPATVKRPEDPWFAFDFSLVKRSVLRLCSSFCCVFGGWACFYCLVWLSSSSGGGGLSLWRPILVSSGCPFVSFRWF